MSATINRRQLLRSASAVGFAAAAPRLALADAPTLVAATFPGTWSEADRNVILPAFKQATGASVTQSIVLGTDQVSRLAAAKGNKPPFDVAFFDAPQVIDAVREG
jgi:putative spermidine/putrescine transport system substrate-binding protein